MKHIIKTKHKDSGYVLSFAGERKFSIELTNTSEDGHDIKFTPLNDVRIEELIMFSNYIDKYIELSMESFNITKLTKINATIKNDNH